MNLPTPTHARAAALKETPQTISIPVIIFSVRTDHDAADLGSSSGPTTISKSPSNRHAAPTDRAPLVQGERDAH